MAYFTPCHCVILNEMPGTAHYNYSNIISVTLRGRVGNIVTLNKQRVSSDESQDGRKVKVQCVIGVMLIRCACIIGMDSSVFFWLATNFAMIVT